MSGGRAALSSALLWGLAVGGCALDWDALDPRASGPTTAAAGGGGTGGAATGTTSTAAAGAGGGGGAPCGELYGGAASDTFADIELVPELVVDGTAADDPRGRGDLLELYFNSDRSGEPFQIFRATRDCETDPWQTPTLVGAFDLGLESTSPVLSFDATTMYLAYAIDPVVKDFDIYVADRPSMNAVSWSTPQIVPELSSTSPDRPGWLAPDGLTIVFDSQRSGNGDLYVATRASSGSAWDTPIAVAELATDAVESAPTLTGDGLTIYFHRVVPGESGNIFRAVRASTADAWDPPEVVAELATAVDDSDPWISPDGRLLLFVRPVDGAPAIHRALR